MLVRELIELLKTKEPEMPVVIARGEELDDVDAVRVVTDVGQSEDPVLAIL